MRLTQGTFSFLPDLTDDQIRRQVAYCIKNAWAVNVEFTDDPHPRNTYWEMWGQPMFDLKDPAAVLYELGECRKVHKGRAYIRLAAFDATSGWEIVRLRCLTERPVDEQGFALVREVVDVRSIHCKPRADHSAKRAGHRE